jgi:hypothetical protein
MKMKKIVIVLFTIASTYIVIKLAYPLISANYFNVIEYWSTKDGIEWSKNRKIRWSDFNYDQNNKDCQFHEYFTFSTRYNIEAPFLFRSKTIFLNKKSFICDTTNNQILRAVQARFDLLEIYRRKMVREVDSVSKRKNKLTLNYLENLNKKYYTMFENEFEKYSSADDKTKSLHELETRIILELK